MRIGILTSGGDCPGINATIRGVCKTAINHYGMEVIGIHSGFQGLLTKDVESFTEKSLSGLLNLGGTMLGTSREKPFKKNGVMSGVDKPALIARNIEEMGLDCVVCIGGNGTQKTAAKLSAMGLNIVSVPKTIDNDIWGTDFSFGFDSAVSIATDAIDRLHSTASSHKRNGNPYSLEAAASAARLLLCGNETLLATLGGSTPNSLHPAFYRLHPVFCRDMDCPLRP